MSLAKLQKEIHELGDPAHAKHSLRFFKTGKGEYGEGDKFLGLTMPVQRKLVKKYGQELTYADLENLLASEFHEFRMIALLVLVDWYGRAARKRDSPEREKIYRFYLSSTAKINNWDLVDVTTPRIVGVHLLDACPGPSGAIDSDAANPGARKILHKFSRSRNLWERRISVLATFMFIKYGQFEDALKIAEILLGDKHDLIHKAVGWMLREIGKKNQRAEERFLQKHYKYMPRTMLRYAIEKFSGRKRRFYLGK